MKKRVGIGTSSSTFSAARNLFLCSEENSIKMMETVNCFQCFNSNRRGGTSSDTFMEKTRPKSTKLKDKNNGEKSGDEVCLLRESPFRILRVSCNFLSF